MNLEMREREREREKLGLEENLYLNRRELNNFIVTS
jgi:hypothetical protein